jgi:hypothetical protein
LRTARLRSPGETAEADCRGLAAASGQECGPRIGTRRERREVSSAFARGALVLLFGGLYGGVRWRARLP